MNKTSSIAIAFVTVFLAAPSFAADMAVKAPVPMAPVYSWTGFYLGGNVGYGWKDAIVSLTPNDPVSFGVTCGNAAFQGGGCPGPASFNTQGVMGGVQVGYNFQVNQRFLLGVEADFNGSGIRGTGTSVFGLNFTPSAFVAGEKVDWFGTVRARAGYLANNNLLLFVTGGWAYGRVEQNARIDAPTVAGGVGFGGVGYDCSIVGPRCFVGNSARIASGWTAGAGFEYAVSRNVSVKAEYLYVNLGGGGAVNVAAQSFAGQPGPSSFIAGYSTLDFNVVRVGMNYQFH